MKSASYIFIILFLQLCSSCLAQDKIDYKNERLIVDCMTEKYDSIGINLQEEAKKYEQKLLESGHLKDNLAKSYILLLDELLNIKRGDSPYSITLDAKLMELRKKCVEENKTNLDSTGKFYEARLLMDSVLKNQETITTEEIIDANRRVWHQLSEQDFKEPYYRISILNMISTFSISKQEKFLIKIYIDLDHNIVLNDNPTTLDDLGKQLKAIADTIPDTEKKYIRVQIKGDSSLDMGIVIDIREILRENLILSTHYNVDK